MMRGRLVTVVHQMARAKISDLPAALDGYWAGCRLSFGFLPHRGPHQLNYAIVTRGFKYTNPICTAVSIYSRGLALPACPYSPVRGSKEESLLHLEQQGRYIWMKGAREVTGCCRSPQGTCAPPACALPSKVPPAAPHGPHPSLSRVA